MNSFVTTPILLVAIGGSLCARAQSLEHVVPAAVGLNGQVLQEFENSIERAVLEGKIVGCQALLCKDDKIALSKVWGLADREAGTPLADDAIFRIYSMTKPITSVAVMQLAEQGKLKLDAPVANYIKQFENLQVRVESAEGEEQLVDCQRPMTVRDLLRHTSGLTYGFSADSQVDQQYRRAGVLRKRNLLEMIDELSRIPLQYQPGERWNYSVSTDVLGHVVEVVSGQRFDEYLHEHIFDPLGMQDTFFSVPTKKQHRLTQMYAPDEDGGLRPAGRQASYRFVNPTEFFSGGGGLCSTADDYLRFSRMLLGNGTLDGVQILTSESLEEMTRNQLEGPAQTNRLQFGLGFSISRRGDYSWGGAAGTRFWVDPKNNVIGLFMIQINPYRAEPYGDQLKQAVFRSLED